MGERPASTRFALAGRLAGWASLFCGLLPPAGAQFSPAGAQFQVNSYTTERQRLPAIASDANGNFVIVWQSYAASADTSRTSIQAQRYDAHGAPLCGQFQVNSYTMGYQSLPAIASDAQGNFVVVWQSHSDEAHPPPAGSIRAQRYDAAGGALGEEFQVNSYASVTVSHPEIGSDALGNFIIVWSSRVSGGSDADLESIQAQRFAADGLPLGGQFQVNSYTTSHQVFPVVAVEAQGDFIVAWASAGSSSGETSSLSLQAQRYLADGAPVGGQFQVNSVDTEARYLLLNEFRIAVESQAPGGFVVAWKSYGSNQGDTSQTSVHARIYDADTVALGEQFQVNAYTTKLQIQPAIVSDAQGNFVIVWTSYGSFEGDTLTQSIQGRRYTASGVPVGGQFQLNSYISGSQFDPATAIDALGNFVVAWTSYGSVGGDTQHFSVQAQRFDGLFRDDLETAGTARWSTTVP